MTLKTLYKSQDEKYSITYSTVNEGWYINIENDLGKLSPLRNAETGKKEIFRRTVPRTKKFNSIYEFPEELLKVWKSLTGKTLSN